MRRGPRIRGPTMGELDVESKKGVARMINSERGSSPQPQKDEILRKKSSRKGDVRARSRREKSIGRSAG